MNKKILPILLLGASMYASENQGVSETHPDHKIFKLAMHNIGSILHVAKPTFQTLMDSKIISKEHGTELLMATELIDRVYKNINESGSALFQAIPSEADKAAELSVRRSPVVHGNHPVEDVFLNHGAGDGK